MLRPVPLSRSLWRSAALALLVAAPLAAEERPALIVHAFTLQNQPAAEALAQVHPLLSLRGSVQLQRDANTLVLRDEPLVVEQIARLLRAFDHPVQRLAIRIQVVRAGDGGGGEGLDPELLRRLRELLRYDSYRMVAAAELEAREGEQVSYELGEDHLVAFRLGTVMAGERIKLRDFEVTGRAAAAERETLLRTRLNLWLDRPMIVGLARDESSHRALLLVLTCRLGGDRSP